MLNKFCVMFSNFTYDLISYHRLVVERELWSGGSRISFLCVLLNDGIHTCNKHTVVTQDISELPYNVTMSHLCRLFGHWTHCVNIKKISKELIKYFCFQAVCKLQSKWPQKLSLLQTIHFVCLRANNSIMIHEPHILFSKCYISILPIIAPSTACHEEVSQTHSYKKTSNEFLLRYSI